MFDNKPIEQWSLRIDVRFFWKFRDFPPNSNCFPRKQHISLCTLSDTHNISPIKQRNAFPYLCCIECRRSSVLFLEGEGKCTLIDYILIVFCHIMVPSNHRFMVCVCAVVHHISACSSRHVITPNPRREMQDASQKLLVRFARPGQCAVKWRSHQSKQNRNKRIKISFGQPNAN